MSRKSIFDALDRYRSAAFVKAVNAAMFECADTTRAEAHASISRGSVSGKRHKPSAPGEPPNRDSGVLQAHLRTEITGPLEVQVVSEAAHAAPLEFGSSKMAARPSLRPARDKVAAKAESILIRHVERAMKVY